MILSDEYMTKLEVVDLDEYCNFYIDDYVLKLKS